MKRGILNITRSQLLAVISMIDINKFVDTPLYSKLNAVINSSESSLQIELSEDELEILLDEVGAPDPSASSELREAIQLMGKMISDFRTLETQGY